MKKSFFGKITLVLASFVALSVVVAPSATADPIDLTPIDRVFVPNVYHTVFSPDDSMLIAVYKGINGGNGFSVFDVNSIGKLTFKTSMASDIMVKSVIFSPDGRFLAVIARYDSQNNGIYMYRIDDENTLTLLGGTSSVSNVDDAVFSPDGSTLYATGYAGMNNNYVATIHVGIDGSLTSEGSIIDPQGSGGVGKLSISHNGALLASASAFQSGNNAVTIYDIDDNGVLSVQKVIFPPTRTYNGSPGVAFSPDDSFIAFSNGTPNMIYTVNVGPNNEVESNVNTYSVGFTVGN